MKYARPIAVWLLLLALPLQGLAAFTPSARCDSHQSTHASYNGHQNHADAASPAHEHPDHPQHDDSQPTDQVNGHSCCQQVFCGAPSAAVPGMPVTPLMITSCVTPLITLFIPERPPRPPQA